jgi:hypothetical protein
MEFIEAKLHILLPDETVGSLRARDPISLDAQGPRPRRTAPRPGQQIQNGGPRAAFAHRPSRARRRRSMFVAAVVILDICKLSARAA